MRLFAAFALLLGLFIAPPPAWAQSAEERTRLDWVQQRGRMIYEIDRAAWVTTDDLRERIRDLQAAGIRGWTVERDGNAYVVTYYAGEGEARAALYRGRVENRRVVSRDVFADGGRPPLTALQRRLADARNAVPRMALRACVNSPFNVAVIPPETPEGAIDVYVLTPQVRNGYFPFGGHFRATLTPGGEIAAERAFTNSCLEMPVPGRGQPRVAGIGIRHFLDGIPTEIHVFLSIWTGFPLFVAAGEPQRVWIVRPDGIELMDQNRAPRM
ncbi:MAG TPA: hypothetical protein VEW71_07050 [Allosphingosinicella sp.]|nr:hypothetical protein [Allosphingosinicella sp.]